MPRAAPRTRRVSNLCREREPMLQSGDGKKHLLGSASTLDHLSMDSRNLHYAREGSRTHTCFNRCIDIHPRDSIESHSDNPRVYLLLSRVSQTLFIPHLCTTNDNNSNNINNYNSNNNSNSVIIKQNSVCVCVCIARARSAAGGGGIPRHEIYTAGAHTNANLVHTAGARRRGTTGPRIAKYWHARNQPAVGA